MARKKVYDENGNEVKRGSGCLKWVLVGIGVIVIIGLLGALLGSEEENSSTESASTEQTNEEAETTSNASEQQAEQSTSQTSSNSSQESSSSNELKIGEEMEFGTFNLTITDLQLSTDYEGNNVLVYTYNWENTGEDATMPSMSFTMNGFQNNVQTSSVSFVEGVNLEAGQKEVRQGGKIEGAQNSVGIDDMSQPLDLELEETFSFSGNTYSTTINLSELQ